MNLQVRRGRLRPTLAPVTAIDVQNNNCLRTNAAQLGCVALDARHRRGPTLGHTRTRAADRSLWDIRHEIADRQQSTCRREKSPQDLLGELLLAFTLIDEFSDHVCYFLRPLKARHVGGL